MSEGIIGVFWFLFFFLRMARATGGVPHPGVGMGDLLRAVGGEVEDL